MGMRSWQQWLMGPGFNPIGWVFAGYRVSHYTQQPLLLWMDIELLTLYYMIYINLFLSLLNFCVSLTSYTGPSNYNMEHLYDWVEKTSFHSLMIINNNSDQNLTNNIIIKLQESYIHIFFHVYQLKIYMIFIIKLLNQVIDEWFSQPSKTDPMKTVDNKQKRKIKTSIPFGFQVVNV